MENKLVKDFLAEQTKLINATAHSKPADKHIVRPEKAMVVQVDPDDPEEMFNYILDKKPSHKKVLAFLQKCIDTIIDDDD